MELTCEALEELLRRQLGLSPENLEEKQRKISRILPYSGNPGESDCLYLAREAVCGVENLLVISSCPQSIWHILVPEEQIDSTIGSILSLFQAYLVWSGRCAVLSLSAQSLQEFVEGICPFPGLTWCMLSPDYRYLATWPESFFMDQLLDLSQAMPLKAMDELYSTNPDYDDTYTTRGLCAYPYYQAEGLELYYWNVRQEQLYLGRFLIGIPCPGLVGLVSQLCTMAEQCYLRQYLRTATAEIGSLRPVLKRLFTQEPVNQEELDAAFFPLHRQEDTEWQVIWLVSNGYYHSEDTLNYYASQLELTFPHLFCVTINEGIACLHRLRREALPDFRQQLSEFLRENLFIAGISNFYSRLEKSGLYLLQARDAMALGQRYTPSLWRYEFSDYAADYAVEQCLQRYEPLELCPEGIRLLMEYDETHPDSCLTETLYQYYACNFSIQTASAKLFIHRTTFFYRMNKIKSLINLHPENPREVALILLMLTTLRSEKSPHISLNKR